MKQSGILEHTGLKDVCPLLQFIDLGEYNQIY